MKSLSGPLFPTLPHYIIFHCYSLDNLGKSNDYILYNLIWFRHSDNIGIFCIKDEDSEGSLRDFIDDDDENSDESSSESSNSSSGDDDDVVCLSDESNKERERTKESKTHGRRTRSNKDIPSGMGICRSPVNFIFYLTLHFHWFNLKSHFTSVFRPWTSSPSKGSRVVGIIFTGRWSWRSESESQASVVVLHS